jgi:hypothetical protein
MHEIIEAKQEPNDLELCWQWQQMQAGGII